MNKIRFFVVTLILSLTYSLCKGAVNNQALSKSVADSLYANGEYEKAITSYSNIIETEGTAAELYFNLGNSYYKSGKMAKAILNYERALKIDPSDSDIRHNLSIARTKIQDKSSEPSELFFLAWWHSLSNKFSLSFWKMSGLIFFVLSLVLCVVYLSLFKDKRKSYLKSLSIISLTLCLICNLAAWQQYHSGIDINAGIVMSDKVVVKSSPSTSSSDLFIVHSGTRLKIIDSSMKEWSEVEYEEGKEGWIKNEDMEII